MLLTHYGHLITHKVGIHHTFQSITHGACFTQQKVLLYKCSVYKILLNLLLSLHVHPFTETLPQCVCGFCCSLSVTLTLNLTLTSLAGTRQSLKVEVEIEQSRHAPYFINVTS